MMLYCYWIGLVFGGGFVAAVVAMTWFPAMPSARALSPSATEPLRVSSLTGDDRYRGERG